MWCPWLLIPQTAAVLSGHIGACCWDATGHYWWLENTKLSFASDAECNFSSCQGLKTVPQCCVVWAVVLLLVYFQQLPVKQDVSNYSITSIVFPSVAVTGYEKPSGKQEIPVEREGNDSSGLWQLLWVVIHPSFLQLAVLWWQAQRPQAFIHISGEGCCLCCW